MSRRKTIEVDEIFQVTIIYKDSKKEPVILDNVTECYYIDDRLVIEFDEGDETWYILDENIKTVKVKVVKIKKGE